MADEEEEKIAAEAVVITADMPDDRRRFGSNSKISNGGIFH